MCLGRIWTKEDKEYLYASWGYRPVRVIAKHLDRSEDAVISYVKRNKLGGAYSSNEYLTVTQVMNTIGVDWHIIDRWIKKHGLKAKERVLIEQKMILIDINDLLEWMEAHQDKFDATRIEYLALGIEPEWLKIKRKQDYKKKYA